MTPSNSQHTASPNCSQTSSLGFEIVLPPSSQKHVLTTPTYSRSAEPLGGYDWNQQASPPPSSQRQLVSKYFDSHSRSTPSTSRPSVKQESRPSQDLNSWISLDDSDDDVSVSSSHSQEVDDGEELHAIEFRTHLSSFKKSPVGDEKLPKARVLEQRTSQATVFHSSKASTSQIILPPKTSDVGSSLYQDIKLEASPVPARNPNPTRPAPKRKRIVQPRKEDGDAVPRKQKKATSPTAELKVAQQSPNEDNIEGPSRLPSTSAKEPPPVEVAEPPLDLNHLTNKELRYLVRCPMCAHDFEAKNGAPMRRRHLTKCATKYAMTVESLTGVLESEYDRLDEIYAAERERIEKSKTVLDKKIEQFGDRRVVDVNASGGSTSAGRQTGTNSPFAVAAAQAKGKKKQPTKSRQSRSPSKALPTPLRGNRTTSKKKQVELLPHALVRADVVRKMERFLREDEDDDVMKSSSLQTGDKDGKMKKEEESDQVIDQATGDLLAETQQPVFAFPGDQRLAEEKYTIRLTQQLSTMDPDYLLPPASQKRGLPDFLGSSAGPSSMGFPPATQMPSTTILQRSSSRLARRRGPVAGAGNGLEFHLKAEEERQRAEEEREREELRAWGAIDLP